MKHEIATIHERMLQGGDWRVFQQEISDLHAQAATEEEYVTLMEAHRNLVLVGEVAYDAETYAKLLPIAESEYLTFLSAESMEDDVVNPVHLERITRREVEAGRLSPDHPLRELAVDSAVVLGDSAELTAHACRNGNWFFYGMAIAGALAFLLRDVSVSPLWLALVGLIVGWFLNERERSSIKAAIAARRV